MKKLFTLFVLMLGLSAVMHAQDTPLLTGETTPEAITYYDFVQWSIDEGKIAGWYVDFGDGGPFTQFVDNPDKDGINGTDKALYMATTTGIDWWGNFLHFVLETPITITDDNRYLHMMHWRENLNDGWSVNINKDAPWEDADKGTKRFDGNNVMAGQWEDIVIDLGHFKETEEAFASICIILDKDWSDPKDNPATKYYFDEIILSADPLQRGVTILEGTDILSFEDQAQIDELVISTQNENSTYEVIDNPFTDSWLNADGKVGKFSKSADASWWQGFNVAFPGIHVIEYGTKQYLHVLVQTDTVCYIQLHAVDNLGKEYTETFLYPEVDIEGEWYDLVWDLSSSAAAIGSFTVRFDVRVDENEDYINGTPARDFYVDEILLNDEEDPREGTDPSIGIDPNYSSDLKAYSMNSMVYFHSTEGMNQADVFDMLGRNIASMQLDGNSGLNAISVPREGIYILRVVSGSKISTAKVLVN